MGGDAVVTFNRLNMKTFFNIGLAMFFLQHIEICYICTSMFEDMVNELNLDINLSCLLANIVSDIYLFESLSCSLFNCTDHVCQVCLL